MIKFPSIEQFRNVIKIVQTSHDYQGQKDDNTPVYQHILPYPNIEFEGTVKLHGTNAGVVKYKDRIEFQSRERVLTLHQDNSGFMLNMLNKNLDFLFDNIEFKESIAIFGEWYGQGIQKGTAISNCPKMFVVFACQVDGVWVNNEIRYDAEQGIFDIRQFPKFKKVIDFNHPEHSTNELSELTLQVEEKCPVGEFFGQVGVGEGIVWKAFYKGDYLRFKVKGEKHSSSKVKVLATVDVEEIENVQQFVDLVLTESRLQQGITWMKENNKEIDVKTTGDYLRWIITDVIKEEQDTIVENQLDPKKIGGYLNKKAREWYFTYLNNGSIS